MNGGLSRVAAAMDQSPVLGPLVRRTRSARFLERSFGGGRSAEEEMDGREGMSAFARDRWVDGRGGSEGYGTFEAS